tara:strand:+ start:225 stop:536 length:312 start_codon:yes stop_codon:yes gene_type:complete
MTEIRIINKTETQERIQIKEKKAIFADGAEIHSVRLSLPNGGPSVYLRVQMDENGDWHLPDVTVHRPQKLEEITLHHSGYKITKKQTKHSDAVWTDIKVKEDK